MATTKFVGKGTVYFAVGTGPLVSIGNCSKLSLNIAEDKLEMTDYESAGGGIAASISRIKSATLDLTAYSFSPDNLALAIRGSATATASVTAITDEAVVAKAGLNMLARLPSFATGATFTVEPSPSGTAFVEGTDYVRTRSGFTVVAGGGIDPADALHVSYTPLADNIMQGLVSSATEIRCVFEGLNEAESGKPVVVECFKVQLSPAKSLDLIADKWGELALTGTIIKDESKTVSGTSQYFTIKQAS